MLHLRQPLTRLLTIPRRLTLLPPRNFQRHLGRIVTILRLDPFLRGPFLLPPRPRERRLRIPTLLVPHMDPGTGFFDALRFYAYNFVKVVAAAFADLLAHGCGF